MSGVIAGLAITAGTTANSFHQAGKQNKLAKEAREAGAEAMADARKRLSVNFSDSLSIKKEPFQLARDARTSQGAQITEAAVESERGAAAAAGKIQAQSNVAQEGVRTAMSGEMDRIEALQVAEDQRLRDMNANLSLASSAGAQDAAAEAADAAAMHTQQGMAGVGSMAGQGIAAAPLYAKNASGRKTADLIKKSEAAGGASIIDQIGQLPLDGGTTFNGVDISRFLNGGSSQPEFLDFVSKQSPDWVDSLSQQVLNYSNTPQNYPALDTGGRRTPTLNPFTVN